MFEQPLLGGNHEAGVFENAEVLHHAKPGHIQQFRELLQRLAVLLAQSVQEGATGRIGKSFENCVQGMSDR